MSCSKQHARFLSELEDGQILCEECGELLLIIHGLAAGPISVEADPDDPCRVNLSVPAFVSDPVLERRAVIDPQQPLEPIDVYRYPTWRLHRPDQRRSGKTYAWRCAHTLVAIAWWLRSLIDSNPDRLRY